ncbi:MAG: von Willebrand factor type A domain-containing protein [Maribacter sp.]|nr:von Willebrand factor type A domain-containing protein [Maribacter sp.]
MKNVALFLVLMAFSICVNAQSLKISGIVSDSTGPLPGVNISVKGTSNTIQTDFDGYYTISAKTGEILIFSYIGMHTKEVKIGNTTSINVFLEEDIHTLDEVVVVGYATQKKRSLTSSVTVVSASQLKRNKKKAYHLSITQQLKGKVPGAQIIGNNEPTIQIRGTNSRSNREPLYVVDGVPIRQKNNSVVANMNADSIEKVNIYKGAKAKALFGKSAKNGCIVITTKNGKYQVQNDENYARITENQFKKTTFDPLSTFSIDVDKASYSNIRRLINNGQEIPWDAVKIEEMVNYFDYDYPQPKDKHPFSINTEVAQTPWNNETKLVRIGIQGKEYSHAELPASNLTFLIDVSGSMGSANKLPLLKSAFRLLVNQLREKDKVSIVVYAGAAGVVLEPTRGSDKTRILNSLNNLEAGGSTAGGQGIKLAYKLAEKNFVKKGNNRVILATDGDFNVGASSNKEMEELIEEKRKSGVFLSVLGFGMGNYKDSKLEILADQGNGNHAYVDSMQEAQKVFGKEFGGTLYTIAKDVKIQVEFNPAKVQAYRLIGYENRLLEDVDFIDDTKDAGELGSGHTVTALYEVIPVGVISNFIKETLDLKYTTNENNKNYSEELLTVKFRYKKPNEEKSIEMVSILNNDIVSMSPDFKFSSAVALFGMHLRKSQYKNDTVLSDVIKLAEAGRGIDIDGYRAEFIRLIKARNLNL